MRRLCWHACVCVLAAASIAAAPESSALYQATAIVTGMDMRQRPLGFSECLTEVLMKVAGAPGLRDDPAVTALARHAADLVASYSYIDPRAGRVPHDDQGTYDRSYELTVRFDPVKIDAALGALHLSPWRGPRPLLEPVILVRPTNEPPFYLSADTPRGSEMRSTVVLSASQQGLGVRFPAQADLDAWGMVPFGFPAPLAQAESGRLQIVGSLGWDIHVGGWVGSWRVRLNGIDHDWRSAGGSYDQALADMVRGAVTLARGAGSPEVAPR
jgi:hypothetical protein